MGFFIIGIVQFVVGLIIYLVSKKIKDETIIGNILMIIGVGVIVMTFFAWVYIYPGKSLTAQRAEYFITYGNAEKARDGYIVGEYYNMLHKTFFFNIFFPEVKYEQRSTD